jgi:phosphatidate cytidylyltransferase
MVRLLSGLVLAASFLALVWFSSATVLLVVALVVAALAFHEYATLTQAIGMRVRRIPSLAATLAALAVVPFPYEPIEVVLAAGLILTAAAAMRSVGRTEQGTLGTFTTAFYSTASSILAPIYIGIPLGALVGIHVYGGRGAVVLLVGTIVISDSAQYYTGRLFGRHPLAPALSPKKTIEGAVGGFVIAPVFTVMSAYYLLPAATNQIALAGVALLLVAAGIAGDLFESLLKRASGLKDSSALIPGHGGVLDRIDALLFASPLFYFYVRRVFDA